MNAIKQALLQALNRHDIDACLAKDDEGLWQLHILNKDGWVWSLSTPATEAQMREIFAEHEWITAEQELTIRGGEKLEGGRQTISAYRLTSKSPVSASNCTVISVSAMVHELLLQTVITRIYPPQILSRYVSRDELPESYALSEELSGFFDIDLAGDRVSEIIDHHRVLMCACVTAATGTLLSEECLLTPEQTRLPGSDVSAFDAAEDSTRLLMQGRAALFIQRNAVGVVNYFKDNPTGLTQASTQPTSS